MRLSNLLTDLKSTSKSIEKQTILKSYDCRELRELLSLSYDPFVLFNVKLKSDDIPVEGDGDMADIFDEAMAILRFCEHSKSSKQNKELIVPFLSKLNKGSQELLIGVLNKNWRVGVNSKTVLKLFPELIKQFNVQLSNKYNRNCNSHKKDRWIPSYKLDGVRCVALRGESGWKLYSRKGKEFLTVEHIKSQLEHLYIDCGWTFFDGELYKYGLSFEEIQGPVMAFTRGQVPYMDYHIFIAGDATKFLNSEDPNHVDPLSGPQHEHASNIYFVNDDFIGSKDIELYLERAFDLGYEGIMLRDPDHLYDYKRSDALLKLKSRSDDSMDSENDEEVISDCTVVGIEYNDNFYVIEDEHLTTKRLLNKIIVIQDNGIKCKVGSGYSLEFRYKYTNSPLDLIGKVVEVKHQRWGANGRMRFSRLHRVREDL